MGITFGLSTMAYHQEPIKRILTYIHKRNIQTVEIRPYKGHFELKLAETVEKLKKKIEELKIDVSAIHMPLEGVDISHQEEYDRVRSIREVEKVILAAHRLESKLIIVHPGGIYHHPEERKNKLNYCMESLEEIMDFANQHGIRIAIENTPPGRLGDQWEDIRLIVSNFSKRNIGICLDTGHYLLNQNRNIPERFNLEGIDLEWPDQLIHIHVHDNDGKQDLHLLPGEGIFPWDSFFDFLKEIHYEKSIIFEQKEQANFLFYLDRIQQEIHKIFSILE